MDGLSVEVVFLLGAAGTAAPEILRLYELRTKPDEFQWTWSYLVFTVLFLVLGGLVSVILPATTVWGAFYTGLSLPVIISAAAKKAPGELTAPMIAATGEGKGARGATQPQSGWKAYINALL